MDTSRTQPDCVFCLQNNLLKGDVLYRSEQAFAIRARGFDNCYLIIPTYHVESLLDIDDDWWQHFKDALKQLPDLDQYNLSLNYGKNAGQTVRHLHFWIVKRTDTGEATGKGLATLVRDADQA